MKAKRRVLVLDDDDGIRLSLENVLTYLGFDVTTTATSSQFIEALENHERFDLVITDFNLADLSFDGLHAATMTREKDPQLPIVMITAGSPLELSGISTRKNRSHGGFGKAFQFFGVIGNYFEGGRRD